MKLYLSSYGLGDCSDQLLKMVPRGAHAGIICNALDNVDESSRSKIYKREEASLVSLGYKASPLDLRDFFIDNSNLKSSLRKFDLIWVSGGNIFILNKAFFLSGFENIIKELIGSNALTYGGYSAGAAIMGQSLKGLELVDDKSCHPKDYPVCQVIWDGLSLVEYSIAPHYKSDHPESEQIEEVITFFEAKKIKYKAIKDGEVIVVNN